MVCLHFLKLTIDKKPQNSIEIKSIQPLINYFQRERKDFIDIEK